MPERAPIRLPLRPASAVLAAALAAAVLLLSGPAPAQAGVTFQGCIRDTSASLSCATSAPGLTGAAGLALSPDGSSLYTASLDDSTVDVFSRDPGSGAPAFSSCWQTSNTGYPAECGASRTPGLTLATSVVTSPDGRSVYAVGGVGNAVVAFSRNTTTGALTPIGCVSDPAPSMGETPACAAHMPGLAGANSVAISADGESVYVAGAVSSALAVLGRDTTTGALTPGGCVRDTAVTTPCAASAAGLLGPLGVAVAPDGRSVYVAARDSSSVAVFDRAAGAGHALTARGCVSQTGVAAGAGCTQHALSLRRATKLAVSGDSRTVTVAGDLGQLSVFARNLSSGDLSFAGCIHGDNLSESGDGCALAPGTGGAGTLTISPDGANVYVGGRGIDVLLDYARDSATGILTFVHCVRDSAAPAGTGCSQVAEGLRGAGDLAVSPDGAFLYAASQGQFTGIGALLTFRRALDGIRPHLAPHLPPILVVPPSGKAGLAITCPGGATKFCDADVTVQRAGAASAKALARARVRRITGKGGRTTVRLRLSKAARRRSHVSVRLVRHNPNGTATTVKRRVRLRLR